MKSYKESVVLVSILLLDLSAGQWVIYISSNVISDHIQVRTLTEIKSVWLSYLLIFLCGFPPQRLIIDSNTLL